MNGATTGARAGRMAVAGLAAVLALAGDIPAQQAGDEPDLEAVLARYEELQRRTRDLVERAERAETRNRALRERLEGVDATLERLRGATEQAGAKLQELGALLDGFDEAWLRNLAEFDHRLEGPVPLPWEARARQPVYAVSIEVETVAREGEAALARVRETVVCTDELIHRRREVAYRREGPVWLRHSVEIQVLRRGPAPPWVRVEAEARDGGGHMVRVGDRTWTVPGAALPDDVRSAVRDALADRVRAWSEASVPRADIPAWIEATHAVPPGLITALFAVLQDAGADAVQYIGHG